MCRKYGIQGGVEGIKVEMGLEVTTDWFAVVGVDASTMDSLGKRYGVLQILQEESL